MRFAIAAVGLFIVVASCGQSDAANVGCTYDALNRLVRVDYYEKGVEFTYEYDANGNRAASAVTAVGDSDGDGLNDILETFLGTDPNDSDTDGDLMPDGWEVAYGLSPFVDDAYGNLDGDPYSNLAEYFAGTDPSDATAFPTWGGALAGAMDLLLLSDEDEAETETEE